MAESGWIEEDGSQPDPNKDLSTKGERALGRLIREKYHTDYYILGSFDSVPGLNARLTDDGYLMQIRCPQGNVPSIPCLTIIR